MDKTLGSQILEKNIRKVEIDAHCTEVALVVRYQTQASVIGQKSSLQSDWSQCQKIIRLKDFNPSVDISSLAKYIIQKCPFIPSYRMIEVEQILYYLQKRQNFTHSASSSSSLSDSSFISRANLDKIDEYIEMMYEEIGEKVRGSALLLELSRNACSLHDLVENETLMGLLVRVLRDDWKKNFDLAINITSFFLNISMFSSFHTILAHNKVGTTSLQIIEFELKRWDVWKNEARVSSKHSTRKWIIAMRKQQILISASLNLLLNLSEDVKVEVKLVNRGFIATLLKCIVDRENSPDLLDVAINFLLKLSIFAENRKELINGRIVELLSLLFPIDMPALRKSALKLLFNLSFDQKLRDQMVSCGVVPYVAKLLNDDEQSNIIINLLYQLSINDDAKAMMTFTDIMQLLLRQVLNNNASLQMKALLINIVSERRNAQIICGQDGQGLDRIVEMACEQKDQMLLKVLRNIATHSGPSILLLSKWAPHLLKLAMLYESSTVNTKCEAAWFSLESLRIVNQLNNVDWDHLAKEFGLINWVKEKLENEISSRHDDDFGLQLVILCGTMARQLNAARLLLSLVNQFVNLLSAQQEDDEMVVQIVYIFYNLLTHEELSESLMGGSAQIGAYLIDLMHDSNLPIRMICDRALSLISERSEEWAKKMDIERFRWHNAQWLSMITESNGTSASIDSAISGSFDILNDVLGAEDILEDSVPNDLLTTLEYDF